MPRHTFIVSIRLATREDGDEIEKNVNNICTSDV